MFVQVSVADVVVWYPQKAIYGNCSGVFDTTEVGDRALQINGINLIKISCNLTG